MATRKKRDIKFCPLCNSPVTPNKDDQYSLCPGCGLEFFVCEKPKQAEPAIGGHSHRNECGVGKGKNSGLKQGKLRFGSVADAFARSLTLEEIPHRYHDRMSFYQSRFCGFIHMGHGGNRTTKATVRYTYDQAREAYEKEYGALPENNSEISETKG